MKKKVYIQPIVIVEAMSPESICVISKTNVEGLGYEEGTSEAGVTSGCVKSENESAWDDVWNSFQF